MRQGQNVYLWFVCIILFSLCVFQLPCGEVSTERALLAGSNFLFERNGYYPEKMELVKGLFKNSAIDERLFVFTFEDQGMMIMPKDDKVTPVVYYSLNAPLDEKPPPQLGWMLSTVVEYLLLAEKSDLKSPAKVIEEWNRLAIEKSTFIPRKTIRSISPLVTSTWDQDRYYNEYCPADSSGPGGHALVGCVAVTVGQVLNYYQYPPRGKGSHSFGHDDYGTLSADFESAVYNWDNMPDSLSSSNHDVALILYHIGVSINMDYGPRFSGVPSEDIDRVCGALKKYFRFPMDVNLYWRDDYGGDWMATIKNELNAGRPIGYGGANSSGVGHAFVLDGYDGGNFHVNWGWGGSYDGYFNLNDLTPGGFNFNYGQGMILPKSDFHDDSYEENDCLETAWYPGRDWESEWISDINGDPILFDEDWYKINVNSGEEQVTISCRFSHEKGNIDMGLYDPSENLLALSNSTTDDEYIKYTVKAAGPYYIRIYNEGFCNKYDLGWMDEAPPYIHQKTWDDFTAGGWTKCMTQPDGTLIDGVPDDFYVAGHPTSGGSIGVSGDEAKDVYGSWESPADAIPYIPGYLYRMKYSIHTTQTNPESVPNCRLLTECIIDPFKTVCSGGNRVGRGPFAPDADGETYNVYLAPPDFSGTDVSSVRVKFEVIDFSDQESGTNFLDNLVVERIPMPDKSSGNLVRKFDDTGDFSPWTQSVLGSPFGSAALNSDSNGLSITTPMTLTPGSIVDYGMWSLAPSSSPVNYEANKLYRAVYTLSTPTATDELTIGKIRVFNHNYGSNWIALLILLPDHLRDHMPVTQEREYSVFYESLPKLYSGDQSEGNKMGFMFDVADGLDSQGGTVILEKVELLEYDIP